MVNISLFPIHKRKGINIERCKVTQALLCPQLRLSCRTVTLTPGAALPAGHCSTTDSMSGIFMYRWPILLFPVLKAFSLGHFAQLASTSMSSDCGWWGKHHPGNCTGCYSQTWCGQGWGSAWGVPGPSVPTPVSRGLQPAWKNSPLTKAQHKGPVSVGFPSLVLLTSHN